MEDVPLRSYLFAPGNDEGLLAKVFAAGADAVVLDLEDAVPAAEKGAARRRVSRAIERRAGSRWPRAWVRMNGLQGDEWRLDVEAVVGPGLTGLRVPKAESRARLEELDQILRAAEERTGLPVGSVRLACSIESARGVLAAADLAGAPRVAHLCFGAADFAADVGCTLERPETTLWARSKLVLVSRAADIAPPVAPVHTRLKDRAGLLATTREARDLGFFGRSCIHPAQLETIHRIFTPSQREVARGREVLEAQARAEDEGRGVAVLPDGRFVDPALVRHARRVVELARLLEARGATETAGT